MLMIGRPVDPPILEHMTRTEQAVAEYQRLDQNRSWLQIAFAWIFAIVALLVLLAAVLIGLVLANQIARPIGRADPRRRTRARRRSGGAGGGGADRRRTRRPVARVQPHDRPARRAARRADGGLQPDRRAPAVHRDGAVGRLRRRDRPRRIGPHRAAEPRGRRIARRRSAGGDRPRPGRRGAGIRRPAARGGGVAGTRAHGRDPDRAADASGARCWCASAPTCQAGAPTASS